MHQGVNCDWNQVYTSLELCGIILELLELLGNFWNYLKIFGITWKYLELLGNICNYLEIFGIIWKFLELLGNISNYLEIFGIILSFFFFFYFLASRKNPFIQIILFLFINKKLFNFKLYFKQRVGHKELYSIYFIKFFN